MVRDTQVTLLAPIPLKIKDLKSILNTTTNRDSLKPKKSWREKLADSKDLPRTETIPPKLRKSWGEGTFVIPAPLEVNELMKKVPKGKLTTINDIRKILAQKHGTDIACPITTGIFAWIAANAAAEDEADGKKRVTPYWRTLKSNGELNEKYPGGIEKQTRLLQAEGFEVINKGKKSVVYGYHDYLMKI